MALLPPPPPTYGAGDYYAKSVDTRPQPWQTESYRASPPTWYTPQPYFDPPPSSDDPYHSQYGSRWHDESPIDELNGTQMYRRLQEYNDLMTWMDNEFWEQSEEIYREKLQSLQEELRHIQEGTHSGFKEVLSDLEHKREQSIADAECFMEYQLTFAEQQYDQDMATVEDEYENERRNLHDTLMSAMEERRKQIKEDKDEGITDIEELFREAYSRVSHRRTLRKRTPFDKLSNGTSTRPETTRRRQVRTSSPHNINAQPTTKEEEELEADFMSMKGILPARRLNASGTTSRR
ncbi:hypothetical protein DFQ28_007451 [Apophysomyces sp. BC1034]|nr:hypothetical protein DFQ30_009759 [Apophysomyces sp. BC1015]KAG0182383.1 hypothetical protein DFQ29_004436 [Apophysomyces sp. BC1021]KAG0192841.1 hypothetical protein DFQ28_007451 [Apophysomyces sp. BC1034]